MTEAEEINERNPFLREDGTLDEEKIAECWNILQETMDSVVSWINNFMPVVINFVNDVNEQLREAGLDVEEILAKSREADPFYREEGNEYGGEPAPEMG